MQILLISGFLGAGKTTFIKELITRTDKKPVIMENEYGANNLDSLELQNSSPKSGEIKVDGIEIVDAKWFSKEEIDNPPLGISIFSRLVEDFKENY